MGPLLMMLLMTASAQAAPPAGAVSQHSAARPLPWEDFPALLWVGTRADAATLELAREIGGALVIGGAPRPADLPFLVFNAAGRDALHLDSEPPAARERIARWIETRDDVLLVRSPCLTDPATRAELFARLQATLAAREGQQGLGISLGDEVSLTPNGSPWDACLSATCRSAWRTFLAARHELDDDERARYGDLAAISTDAARATLADGNTRDLEPWFLRRAFHQQVVTDLLLELAARARATRPEVPIGLLGLIGRTAFGGVEIAPLLPVLDFLECYSVSDAREQVFTSRASDVRVLQTVFPSAVAPQRAAWRTFEHWLRGGTGVVVWSDRELAAAPAARARIGRALEDVRHLARELGPFSPRPAGVALVHSNASVALAWLREALLDGPTWPNRLQGLQERRGRRESSLRSWLRLLEDLRLMPGALPIEAVDGATATRFPALVLHYLAVLDEADVAGLEAYLAAGGALFVEGELGWIDTRGRRRDQSLFTSLAEHAPGQVHAAPGVAHEYAALRRTSPARARDARAAWWPELSSAGVLRAPFEVKSADEGSAWLCAWSPSTDGQALICAALPNTPQAPGALSRERLLAVEVGPEHTLEWVHPTPSGEGTGEVLLRAGDAAVFRLVPHR